MKPLFYFKWKKNHFFLKFYFPHYVRLRPHLYFLFLLFLVPCIHLKENLLFYLFGRIVLHARLENWLKILISLIFEPKTSYGWVKIELKDITFQNLLKCLWLPKSKKEKKKTQQTSHFSLILSLFIHLTFLLHINWWDHIN